MKKKNVIIASATAGVAAVALTVGLCVGLVACKEDNPEEKFVPEQITKAEWDAAFAMDNFSNAKIELVNTVDMRTVSDGKEESTHAVSNYSIVRANGKDYMKVTAQSIRTVDGVSEKEEFEQENYVETLSEGGFMRYEKTEAGKWTKNKTSESDVEQFLSYYIRHEYDENYDYTKFTYNETDGYVWETEVDRGDGKTNVIYTVQFKDKKVYKLSLQSELDSQKDETETGSTVLTFAYGGQTVTLPEVKSEVYGTYKFYSMTMNLGGTSTTVYAGDQLAGGIALTEDYITVTLKNDGTAVITSAMGELGSSTKNGTFTLSGEKVTVTIENEPTVFTWDSVDMLTATISQTTIVLKK